jgi:hypothetical protein
LERIELEIIFGFVFVLFAIGFPFLNLACIYANATNYASRNIPSF